MILYNYTVHCTIGTRAQSVKIQQRRRISQESEMVTYKAELIERVDFPHFCQHIFILACLHISDTELIDYLGYCRQTAEGLNSCFVYTHGINSLSSHVTRHLVRVLVTMSTSIFSTIICSLFEQLRTQKRKQLFFQYKTIWIYMISFKI